MTFILLQNTQYFLSPGYKMKNSALAGQELYFSFCRLSLKHFMVQNGTKTRGTWGLSECTGSCEGNVCCFVWDQGSSCVMVLAGVCQISHLKHEIHFFSPEEKSRACCVALPHVKDFTLLMLSRCSALLYLVGHALEPGGFEMHLQGVLHRYVAVRPPAAACLHHRCVEALLECKTHTQKSCIILPLAALLHPPY